MKGSPLLSLTAKPRKFVYLLTSFPPQVAAAIKTQVPVYKGCETEAIKKSQALSLASLNSSVVICNVPDNPEDKSLVLCAWARDIQNAVTAVAIGDAPNGTHPAESKTLVNGESAKEPLVISTEPAIKDMEPVQKKLKSIEKRVDDTIALLGTLKQELLALY